MVHSHDFAIDYLLLILKVGFLTEPKSWRWCVCSVVPAASLLCLLFFIGSAFIATDSKENYLRFTIPDVLKSTKADNCQNQCRAPGSEPLPSGIVTTSSNLEMRPLWGVPKSVESRKSLFAMAVGINQKDMVNKMVEKFLGSDFAVMLFHYDGAVDKWSAFEWNDQVLHVSAANQTKWWFAKRFMHPDIVSEYAYVFLWDEDLGVDNFDPKRYLSIIKKEGLEISQPALDPAKSEVHHQITARGRRSAVHRRIYKSGGPGKGCDYASKSPPCTGWIEMMAPVFSRAAWRCVWYMIQNDLIHAWGLDIQLGYCAQGDRTENVGVVDAEYIIHHGLPTLGGSHAHNKTDSLPPQGSTAGNDTSMTPDDSQVHDPRSQVRRQSRDELTIFRTRWRNATLNDPCWVDPYPDSKFS
uniref:Uncharacterized protein n=1 Tax=Kalanchoe fedtschenkoi TaxID=63787 RepID=A0A7N0ZSS3_KALFE